MLLIPRPDMKALTRARMLIIVDEHGGSMTVDEMCAELRRRGWAFDDLSPARMGFQPTDIIRRRQ